MTTQTLFENFEGFSQILNEQSGNKMYLGMFTHPIAIIKKFKLQYLKKNLNVRIFELSENVKMKKVHETVYACSYGA